jgi:hypothetical protein
MSQAAAESLLVFPPGDKEAFVKTQMRNSIHSGHSLDAILSKMLSANEINARDARR